MAVTITQSPQAYTPSDNPVTWTFSSAQTAQSNFYFLVEVMINTVVVERHKAYVEQGTIAHFDASSISERYAEANLDQTNKTLSSISIKVIEYYNSTPGLDVTSSEVKIWKAKLKKSNFVGYNFNNYVLNGALTTKFLTLTPRGTDKAKGTELKYLSFLSDGNIPSVAYKTYTSAGVLIDTQNVNTLSTEDFISISVGVQTLIDDISLDFTGASYYTVQASNSSGSSEVYRINIDTDCDYSTAKRLHFMNTLGGTDSFTFGLITRTKTDVISYGYERQFGSFSSSGVYEYTLERGTTIDYLKQFNKSIETSSNWLIESVQNWLSGELYTSPLVWIETSLVLYRCKVTNTGYEEKIQENDTLFQEVVKIELESDTSANV